MIYLYWKNTLGAGYIAKGVHFLKVLQQLFKVINYLCQSLQKRLDRGTTGVVLYSQYDVLQVYNINILERNHTRVSTSYQICCRLGQSIRRIGITSRI